MQVNYREFFLRHVNPLVVRMQQFRLLTLLSLDSHFIP